MELRTFYVREIKYRHRLFALMLSTLLVACGTTVKNFSEQPVSTKQIVGSIQATLLEVNKQLGEKKAPKIKQAKLILNTTMTKSQQGKMTVTPISVKSGKSQSATGTLTISLLPVVEKRSRQKNIDFTVHEEMAQAIAASIREISHVEQGPVPMKFQQVIAKLSFSVSANASGGISLNLASVSLGGEANSSQSNQHTLEIVFVPQ